MTAVTYDPISVFVEEKVASHPVTRRILQKLPHLTPTVFADLSRFLMTPQHHDRTLAPSRKPLVLAFQKAPFLKRCPGTMNYICCGYQILNLVNNCEMNCSYCILQGYLSSPYIIVYVNIEDMFGELERKLARNPGKIYRIGTGELADSLSTDALTNYSSQLVTFFSDKPNAVIELKTKSTAIENFIGLAHAGRTVAAWSLNTPKLMAAEESLAPTLDQRLAAALKCQSAGFRLAFHFDPMMYYDAWETDYRSVVERLFSVIQPQNILWISLGALRYPPHLDSIIRFSHPQSRIVYGELVPGKDGKLRYFQPIRTEMFGKMVAWIREFAPNVFVYLCMESSEVWQKSFGWSPKTSAGLKRMMDRLVQSL
ncbi:MAG: SPL family radical SAM protein [Candidatus Zhuqueibacterota bacterium]